MFCLRQNQKLSVLICFSVHVLNADLFHCVPHAVLVRKNHFLTDQIFIKLCICQTASDVKVA